MSSQSESGNRPGAQRSARDSLLQLPLLQVTGEYEIDYAASDPALLAQIATNADICQHTIQRGLAAMGYLPACVAPHIECTDIPSGMIEALGFLMAELGDVASVVHNVATACRRYTVDYLPQESTRIPCTRP